MKYKQYLIRSVFASIVVSFFLWSMPVFAFSLSPASTEIRNVHTDHIGHKRLRVRIEVPEGVVSFVPFGSVAPFIHIQKEISAEDLQNPDLQWVPYTVDASSAIEGELYTGGIRAVYTPPQSNNPTTIAVALEADVIIQSTTTPYQEMALHDVLFVQEEDGNVFLNGTIENKGNVPFTVTDMFFKSMNEEKNIQLFDEEITIGAFKLEHLHLPVNKKVRKWMATAEFVNVSVSTKEMSEITKQVSVPEFVSESFVKKWWNNIVKNIILYTDYIASLWKV